MAGFASHGPPPRFLPRRRHQASLRRPPEYCMPGILLAWTAAGRPHLRASHHRPSRFLRFTLRCRAEITWSIGSPETRRRVQDSRSPASSAFSNPTAKSSPPIHANTLSLLSLGLPPRRSPFLRSSAVRSSLVYRTTYIRATPHSSIAAAAIAIKLLISSATSPPPLVRCIRMMPTKSFAGSTHPYVRYAPPFT